VKVRILINSKGVEEEKLHGNSKQLMQARIHPWRNPYGFGCYSKEKQE